MITNLVIGFGIIQAKDKETQQIVEKFDPAYCDPPNSQLPSRAVKWVEQMADSDEKVTIWTTNPTVIYHGIDNGNGDKAGLEEVWLSLPFDRPNHLRKLTDVLERDWIAHFNLADLWMTGRLQHEVETALAATQR